MTDAPIANTAPDAALPKPKENVFVNLIFNIAVPSYIMQKFATPDRLGPLNALLLGLSFPLAYSVYDYIRRREYNFISVVGFFSILISGGLGLLNMDGFWFAVKEAAIPSIIGIALVVSLKTKTPLVHSMIYNDKVIDIPRVEHALMEKHSQRQFNRLLVMTTYMLTASFILSAVLNFVLAIYFLKSPPGTPEFIEEVGKMHLWSWPIIVVPSMIVTMGALWYLLRGIKQLTGLPLDAVFKGK